MPSNKRAKDKDLWLPFWVEWFSLSPGGHVPVIVEGQAWALEETLTKRIQVHRKEAAACGRRRLADQ